MRVDYKKYQTQFDHKALLEFAMHFYRKGVDYQKKEEDLTINELREMSKEVGRLLDIEVLKLQWRLLSVEDDI